MIYPNYDDEIIADVVAVFSYSFFFSLGNISGPIIGGTLAT